ncbi:MAG: response regulator [Desulfobacteraceae bacterium]|nr:MAG: response regulator [Desulfobacteraceae bacterium]
MNKNFDIEKELIYLGLLDKAREIYSELGDRAVLSYIRSSYRLLSKVYHPDLNPKNRAKAKLTQQRLNRVSRLISQIKDEELVELIRKGTIKHNESKKRILVVEDEFGLQEIFRDVFLMEGYDVRVAVNGDNGYQIYREFKPDLVLTDVVMPKMSGLELVRKIRETNTQIKVIYISGFFGINRLKRKLDEEILKYGYPTLSKPFKISIMLDLVKDYLKDGVIQPFSINVFA